ncbi:MAG TPA: alpha-L-fucosidase [Paludibaculum sp.]|jgi:alpha-L-fucosidase
MKFFAVFALLAAANCVCAQDKMEWFTHDKFGMFVHWGPYSVLAGEWKGQRTPAGDEAEWIMQRFNIPVKDYREMAHTLNPVKFDANAYAKLAKAAGMKYLVLTAKHHDGFAMYDSKVSDYNIVKWTPFRRDIVKELSEACKREGIRFCVYYSHREDWDDPNGYGNHWDYDPAKKDFDKYLREKSLPQLRELLTNYGPLGLIWFDRGIDTTAQAKQFINLVRELQPKCLINGRIGNYGHELLGDYQNMNDNGMPTGGLDEYWETPQTLNGTWGYSKFDEQWKTPANVIQRMVEIVSKGGNYLLNIGPKADGTIPAPSVAVMEQVGAWMQKNGESIYGTSACPVGQFPWGRCTVKGENVYLHAFQRPADGVLWVGGLKNEATSAHLLQAPGKKLEVVRQDGVTGVRVPAQGWDAASTVVVLVVKSKPEAEPELVTQGSDSPFHLTGIRGETSGQAMKRFNRDGSFHIGRWTKPEDQVRWNLVVSQPGRYNLRVRYAARPEWAGRKFVVELGGQRLEKTVEATGDWYQYKAFDLGVVTLAAKGPMAVVIRPAAAGPENLMYFESLTLEPITVSGRLGRLD